MNINAYKLILSWKFSSLFCGNTLNLYFCQKQILIASKLIPKATRFFTGLYYVFDFSTLLIRINSLLTFNLHLLLKIIEERVYLHFPMFTFLLDLFVFNLNLHMRHQSSPNLVLQHLFGFSYRQILHPLQQLLLLFKLNRFSIMHFRSNSVCKSPECLLLININQVLFDFILLDREPQFVLENRIKPPSLDLSVSTSKQTVQKSHDFLQF